MNALLSRAAAVIGWIAYATGRLLGGIVWLAPRGVPWALVAAVLFGLGAWRSIEGANALMASAPSPDPVPLADRVPFANDRDAPATPAPTTEEC